MSYEGASTMNNMQLTYTRYGTAAIDNNVNGSEVVKRKRGRPRKNPIDLEFLRPRGRSTQPPAAVVSGSPAAAFMPHILHVKSGEDVLAKLVRFSQNSTRALCILSASGAISNVTLEQIATTGGTVTYEGRFKILSLSGSFMLPENDNQTSSISGLTVLLSGPDGYVLGGNVVGILTAASPVQVIIGSFVPKSRKQSKERGSSEAEVVNARANPQGIVDMLWR